MKYNDHEFDPVTDEERAAREREEELARRIRREVLRVQSGEADEEIRADREREQAEEEARQEEQRKEERRRSNIFWLLFSGNILVRKGASEYYRYMICIAAMFFVSIFVMFTALHLDMKYSRLYREVQMLRERSTRLQEQRFRHTTHSAILEELRRRGIRHHKVVWSPEEARRTAQPESPPPGRRSVPASVPWVPSTAGILLAGAIVRDLIG